jgi:ankyrin repeat protein
LLLAHNEQGIFGTIQEATSGILFFATSHSGTSSETYEDVLLRLGSIILFPTLRDELLEHSRLLFFLKIREIAPVLRRLAEEFGTLVYQLPIVSFVETLPLPKVKSIVSANELWRRSQANFFQLVNLQSATARTAREHIVPIQNHDHRQLCKHSSLDSDGMRLILSELREVIGSPLPTNVTCVGDANRPSTQTTSTAELLKKQNLLRAVATGNFVAVQRLFKGEVDRGNYDKERNTALHIACEKDRVEIGLYLLENGAFVAAANDQGNQPLHLATRGNGKLACAIIKRGGDLDAQNIDGCTPLHQAARAGNAVLIAQMLERGANWRIRNKSNELPVRVARKSLHLDAMKALHNAVGDPPRALVRVIGEERAGGDLLTRDQRNSISMAQNFPSVVSINFDMDRKLKVQASPIAKSAQRGNLGAVEDMLDAGVVPTADALYLAADECRSDVVEVLADVMEDINTSVGWAGNALCAAACRTDGANTMRILLEKGADVNWQGGKYGCALHAATACYRLENVKLLLRYGADVHAQCGHYGNALTAAARHRTHFEEMATIFLELGVDIDAQGPGNYGNALQTAVHRCHVPSVKFLLHHGANANVQGQFGSAVDIARRNLAEEGYVSNKAEKEKILFLLTEDEFDGLAIED